MTAIAPTLAAGVAPAHTGRFGAGNWQYQIVPGWGHSPSRPVLGTISGLASDSQDNVYVFQRNLVPSILVFAPDSTELRQMGVETSKGYEPHGIWVGPDPTRGGGEVLLTTDRKRQQVVKLTQSGEVLAAWGDLGVPGDAGEPFNHPTRAAIAPSGEIFVSDGYGQYRVHRLAPDGTVIQSWGRKGGGPGEFRWPVHSVAIDPRGRVLIADRGNNRIQIFDVNGNYYRRERVRC